jgi:hypothetical protein
VADHPGRRIELWFQDAARIGQKGRTGHRWWMRRRRPRGLCDQRHDWTHLYAAVRPAAGEHFALVLPMASTTAMGVFLQHFAAALAPDVHAVLVLDQQAGTARGSCACPTTSPWFHSRPMRPN